MEEARVGCNRMESRAEGGFSMIEMIVVIAMIAILSSVAVTMFVKAKSNSYEKQTLAAGASYAGAIASFKLDHEGRAPALGNSNDWPTANGGPIMLTSNAAGRQPYIRSGAPDAVLNGSITVSAAAPTAGGLQRGWLQYISKNGGRSYELAVFTRPNANTAWPLAPTCSFGDAIDPAHARC
ncbi:MAG: hypothetical protein JWN41_1499 [Thermoleophilia bacterium]|nr:hypothetical protein [Thermoleophilia bacterium]